ncbi:class I SAM-dependent methyltransferase [Streptomyces sp. NPDC086549]|uniref:class I SAM-dependent methyltransferase n=1 Tax=Streptomyces sp. NPDC086549 TaxID=3365752 RepID=UPI00381FA988
MIGEGLGLAEAQRAHWQSTYTAHPGMYGEQPSRPALYAAEVFGAVGARDVLELGAGRGRDALFFARQDFTVQAADFSRTGLEQLQAAALDQGVGERVTTVVHDVREPLPLPDASVDAVFAHMLLCMALSTEEIHLLVGEVRRVLRPGGAFVYTVRHTGDGLPQFSASLEPGGPPSEPAPPTVTTSSNTVALRCTSSTAAWSTLWPTAGSSTTCTPSRRATCRAACGESPSSCPVFGDPAGGEQS